MRGEQRGHKQMGRRKLNNIWLKIERRLHGGEEVCERRKLEDGGKEAVDVFSGKISTYDSAIRKANFES